MNIANLKKEQIVQMFNFRCKHGHSGIEHPNCFNTEKGIKEKIGFLDIEASNLKANFGIVLSYSILSDTGELIKEHIKPEELKDGTFDKRLIEKFCSDSRRFDRLVTFYGARFDIPFLRTRAVYYKKNFPIWAEIKHTDLYDIIKRKFNLHSRRLAVCCSFFGITAKEHPLSPEIWIKCLSGNTKAIDYVMEHNIEDVVSTKDLYYRILDYAKQTDTSI